MVDSGLVEIGSHTVSHPILSTLNGSQSWDELKNSKDEIEHTLGKQVRSFCFPNGRPADYKSIQVEQVKDAGYNNAVVTRFGLVSTLEKQYELPRIGVSGYTDEITFRKYVDGAEHYQQRLRRSALPTALPGLQIHDQK